MQTPPVITPAESPETIRNANLKHEASVQSIGILYLIGSVLMVVSGTLSLIKPGPGDHTVTLVTGALLIVLGILQGWTGSLLRKLDPRAVMPATLLSCIGLLGVPIGTLVSVYVLYLLHSAKGKLVFSPDYRAVIEATPHIKYKTSVLVWILLGLLLLLLAVGMIAALFAKK
jgi:hypothetical protein